MSWSPILQRSRINDTSTNVKNLFELVLRPFFARKLQQQTQWRPFLMFQPNREFSQSRSEKFSQFKSGKRMNENDVSTMSARLASKSWKPQKPLTHEGSTPCPVFLMHGLLGYKEEFAPFGQVIADRTGREVSAFDARNHGESEHVDKMDYFTTGDDMSGFMETQKVKEAIYVAHSMGAGSAISLSLRRPDLVKALFTIDVGVSDAPRKQQLRQFLKSLEIISFNQSRSLQENRDAIRKTLLQNEVDKFIVEHRVLPNIIAGEGGIQWRINLPVITRDIMNLTQAPQNIRFGDLTYEKAVFVLIGDSSDYVRWDDEALILKNFPAAKTQRVPNAGHWVHLDQPEIFLQAVVKFIQNLDTV